MMLICQEIVLPFSAERSEARSSYRTVALELVVLQSCLKILKKQNGYACSHEDLNASLFTELQPPC